MRSRCADPTRMKRGGPLPPLDLPRAIAKRSVLLSKKKAAKRKAHRGNKTLQLNDYAKEGGNLQRKNPS